MYGIVNKAIKGLVVENFGEEAWLKIKQQSGVNHDVFLSNEAYPDEDTYKLAGTAAEVLGMSLEDVLKAFGEYWILKTGLEHYGSLMKAGGDNLKEFIVNLPNFHSRVMLVYPNLTPPDFIVSDIQENSLKLHYISTRGGLKYFVYGLINGLGKMFQTPLQITIVADRDNGDLNEVYLIAW
jgi:hypothetical protein